MATPKLSLVKTDVHHLGKKPLPEIHFHILKSEIRGLWREGRQNRYELGRALLTVKFTTRPLG